MCELRARDDDGSSHHAAIPDCTVRGPIIASRCLQVYQRKTSVTEHALVVASRRSGKSGSIRFVGLMVAKSASLGEFGGGRVGIEGSAGREIGSPEG